MVGNKLSTLFTNHFSVICLKAKVQFISVLLYPLPKGKRQNIQSFNIISFAVTFM